MKNQRCNSNKLNDNDLEVIARCPNLGDFSPEVHFFFARLIVANPLQYKDTAAGFDALIQAKKKRMNNSGLYNSLEFSFLFVIFAKFRKKN